MKSCYQLIISITNFKKEKGEKLSGERKDNSCFCHKKKKALIQVELCYYSARAHIFSNKIITSMTCPLPNYMNALIMAGDSHSGSMILF